MIGHAALAADNQVNGPTAERLAAFLTGDSKTSWPAAKMHTTAVDCYTGERVVVSKAAAEKNGSHALAHAAAASSSLPGIIGPTLLGQRYCMDGGMCSNPARIDGVDRLEACVDRHPERRAEAAVPHRDPASYRLRSTPRPKRRAQDAVDQGRSAGRQSARSASDPPAIGPGYDRATREAAGIKAFWS